jgi:hypothetical protein
MTKPHRDLFNHQQGSPVMSTPKTSAAAIAMLDELQVKRCALVQTIDSGAERCRGLAVAAHLGDTDAAEELSELETEEVAAQGSLRNLDAAIAGIDQMREALEAKEAATRENRDLVELTSTIDELLELDDQCDDALDAARDLLARRADFRLERSKILRRMPGKFAGSMIGRDSEVSSALQAYFSEYLNAGKSYGSIRIVDGDASYYSRQSPGQIARGPRVLSPFERMMRRELAPRGAPIEVAIPRQETRR